MFKYVLSDGSYGTVLSTETLHHIPRIEDQDDSAATYLRRFTENIVVSKPLCGGVQAV